MTLSNFNWSKWGFWLALTLFFVTAFMWIFQTYIFEKNPIPKYEIISNEEVLVVNGNLSKLRISYDKIDLLNEKKNISILTFRFINLGKRSITVDLYDNDFPIGFQILNGQLLAHPEIIKSSDSLYFKKIINKVVNDSVIFRKIIIDKDAFIDFKCLVLNKIGIKPSILPFGKISGVKEIELGSFTKPKERSIGFYIFLLVIGMLSSGFSSAIWLILVKKLKLNVSPVSSPRRSKKT